MIKHKKGKKYTLDFVLRLVIFMHGYITIIIIIWKLMIKYKANDTYLIFMQIN